MLKGLGQIVVVKALAAMAFFVLKMLLYAQGGGPVHKS